ncbi:MAG: hypothetical protein KGH57_01750 [Candidatus Micrarchaeota archaeon]|nr:hypothetical protein [Candidatus Micrarchaeota archaeon]
MSAVEKQVGGQTKVMLGSTIVGTTQVKDFSQYRNLFIVPGHGICVDPAQPLENKSWSGALDDPKFYVEHIDAGIEGALRDKSNLFMPSGGFTRKAAGFRSEGQSYLQIAEVRKPEIIENGVAEIFAVDSLRNVAYSIALFNVLTGHMPDKVYEYGWTFKEPRLRFNAESLPTKMLNPRDFEYKGVNNPPNLAEIEEKGFEKKAFDAYKADPYGVTFGLPGKLAEKNALRDPFGVNQLAYRAYRLDELMPELAPKRA